MKPLLQPLLVNGPFEDPVLYLDFLFERRALLLDAGELRRLSTRKILRVSDVFVSHAHMDHFADLDWLLRLTVGRGKRLRMFGPAGFVERVGHKLQAYSWNLVRNYAEGLTIEVLELHEGGAGRRARYFSRDGFAPGEVEALALPGGLLLEEPALRVRAAVLDHDIPVLGFAVEETRHVNIWKTGLEALGLPVGPWLAGLKARVLEGAPEDTPVTVRWREDGRPRERVLPLGDLAREAVRVVPGQKIAYVVDVAGHERNLAAIAALAEGADLLYIEATFLDEDRAHARRRHHLTAALAGEVARRAGVGRVEPFHFSPRYTGREAELRAECARAFAGRAGAP